MRTREKNAMVWTTFSVCCNDHHGIQCHHHPHHWDQLYIYINLGKLNVRGFKLKLNGILTFPLFDDCITIILSSLHTTIKLNNNRSSVLKVINMGEVWIQQRAIKMISYGSRKTNLCKVTCKRNIHWRLFPWKRKMCEISWPLLTLMILLKVESHIPWESGWTSEEDPHFHFSFFPLKSCNQDLNKKTPCWSSLSPCSHYHTRDHEWWGQWWCKWWWWWW